METWDRLRGLMGLCARARQAAFGEDGCLKAVRSGQCALLLVDAGASEKTRGKYRGVCAGAGVPMALVPEGILNAATGRSGVAMAVKIGTLAEQMIQLLPESGREARPEKTANNGGGASVE